VDIKQINVDKLIPYINNPRKNDDAVDQVASSIKNFGFKVPIVIDSENEIVTGHTRIKAAKKLGIEEVPCIIADDLTPAQIKAFRIADNKVGEFAEWDMDLLGLELSELEELEFDISDMGFEDEELDDILGRDAEVVEDDFDEEPPDEPESKLGDIWTLGRHRLVCGDSKDGNAIAKLMDGEKADMVFTDPPYGMKLDTDYSKMGSTTTSYSKVIGDDEEFDMTKIFNNIKSPIWYIWGGDYLYKTIPNFDEGVYIVWSKRMSDEENKVFGSAYELCWTYPKRKKEIWFVRGINQSSERLGVHPTQKPTELSQRALKQNKDALNIVDVFGGSGSTLIACEQLNRICYLMELDEKYIDVIVKRYANFKESTDDITLLRDGKEYSYDEVFEDV